MRHQYYVYIMASLSRVTYTGLTNDLVKRVTHHRTGAVPGSFTARYNVRRLVYLESTTYIEAARSREREIKGWRREKKTRLIESVNPEWRDLATDWNIGGPM